MVPFFIRMSYSSDISVSKGLPKRLTFRTTGVEHLLATVDKVYIEKLQSSKGVS